MNLFLYGHSLVVFPLVLPCWIWSRGWPRCVLFYDRWCSLVMFCFMVAGSVAGVASCDFIVAAGDTCLVVSVLFLISMV